MNMRNTRPTAITLPARQHPVALAWWRTLDLALAALLLAACPLAAANASLPALTAPQGEQAPSTAEHSDVLPPPSERWPAPPLPELKELPADVTGQVRPPRPLALRDDVWVVATRPAPSMEHCPHFYRYCGGQRRSAELSDFLAANEDGLPLCVWIHGYQVCPEVAEQMGLDVYEQMRKACPAGVHFRFVIWSWPSRKCGPYRIDARRKARQSDVEGFKLAKLIQQLPPQVPVGLMGFSFGARTTGAALHCMGGGRIANMALADCDPAARPVRAALLAGALDHDAFSPGGLNSHAAQAADRVCVLVNRHDPVLIAYRHLETFRGTMAMGHTGPVGTAGQYVPGQYVTYDVTWKIGFSHCWTRYVNSPAIMQPVSALLLYADWYQPLGHESAQWMAPEPIAR